MNNTMVVIEVNAMPFEYLLPTVACRNLTQDTNVGIGGAPVIDYAARIQSM